MKHTTALLSAAAFATLATACTGAPADAPTAPVYAPSIGVTSDPPPPPINGFTLYAGTGDLSGLSAQRSSERIGIQSSGKGPDCGLATFCVPSRYFLSKTNNNEWLDFVAEEPLPADVRRQLETVGAACGVDLENNNGTLFCDVGSTAQGKITNKGETTRGTGIAYDVSEDRLRVTTVSLEQFDGVPSKVGLSCVAVEGAATCRTIPVFGDVWFGVRDEVTGDITYTRAARVVSPFVFSSRGVIIEPPGDVIP